MQFNMAANVFFIITISYFVVVSGSLIGLPSSDSGNNCRYEFVVPDKTGMCSNGNAGLNKKIADVKEDLDRTRLQYVSGNTILQEQMSKIQNTVNTYGSQMNDLYGHLRQLESQVSSFPSSLGPGGSNDIQRLVRTTKDYFNQALVDMQNKLFNVTYSFQKDAIEQSKVNAAVETQIRSQEQKTKQAEAKIEDLLKMVHALQGTPSATAGTGNISPAMLSEVKSKLQSFDQEIQRYDQMQQQQFSALQQKSNTLALQLSNHSQALNDLSTESQALMARVQTSDTKADQVSRKFSQFQTVNQPRINNLETELTQIKNETDTLKSELSGVATNAMQAKVLSGKEMTDIKDAQQSIDLLEHRLQQVLSNANNQPVTQVQLKQMHDDIKRLQQTIASLQKQPTTLDLTTTLPVQPGTQMPVQPKTASVKMVAPTLPVQPGTQVPVQPKTASVKMVAPTLPVQPGTQVPLLPKTAPVKMVAPTLPVQPGTQVPVQPKTASVKMVAPTLPVQPGAQVPVQPKTEPVKMVVPTLPVQPGTQVPLLPKTASVKMVAPTLPVQPGTQVPLLPKTASVKMVVPTLPVQPGAQVPVLPKTEPVKMVAPTLPPGQPMIPTLPMVVPTLPADKK
ncbi:ESX-1 secretion-associated protein EspK-like isoform X2 [Haliotis rufescens]|uniref:ESX-1 secretion-associated protein EspK-like isoform X2 n=1 Tax=Haliotis rufescens TaxID=6454 RepID=UPI00201F7327|nr:ESX-1 secretion-associated protein EspK-like isoform X2 [Haliotis rufescens]